MTEPTGRKCPDCGEINAADAEYCRKCAHQLIAITGESPVADPNARDEVFGGKGAWLDKSTKEVPGGKREPGPRPLNEVGAGEPELELAYDPKEKARLDAEAAEAARHAWDRGQRKPEFTLRAVLIGIVVAIFVGASYPYVVLKIGFGPNISVVSAFFGYMMISVIGFFATRITGKDKSGGRTEYNLVQTAGTAAGQSGFMCVLLAAFDMLAAKPALNFHVQPTPIQIFLWLSVAGCLGVLLAVPLRRHYIDQEKLTFADGVAAGETLLVLDAGQAAAKQKLRWLLFGGLFSGITTWFRDGVPKVIPENTFFGPSGQAAAEKLNVGMNWSALSFGSGLLVGLRITLSMAFGMVLAWLVLPGVLTGNQWIAEPTFGVTLRWVMWPATGLMVAGGLTALALKWKLIIATFKELRLSSADSTDFPLLWVGLGASVLAVLLVLIQKFSMGIAIWESVVAILISIPLMLVGARVLGETNWAPISAMANMVQAVFAVLSPGNMATNMVASGMSGTVASNGEHLMQDYKAGSIVGSNNRYLTYMQLIATPVGAAAVALVYPLLKAQYGIGPARYGATVEGTSGLSSPISVKWSGFAELLSGGIDKLPPYALYALVAACVVGVVITLLEKKWKNYLPSPTGVGLGMLIPAIYVLPMVIGGVVQAIWTRINKKQEEELGTPLASGLIVGEAMLALIIPLLVYFGLMGSLSEFLAPLTNFLNEKLGLTIHVGGGGH